MMVKKMLANIKLILGAGLVLVALSTSYLSYNFYGKLTVLERNYDAAMVKIDEKNKELQTSIDSCRITEVITTKLTTEAVVMTEKLTQLIVELDIVPEGSTNVPHNANISTAAGTILSAPDAKLKRLLDDAYCTADAGSSYCTTR